MKRNRNPTNKSVMKRYTTLDSSIGSRSSFVHPSFILRSRIEEQSKMDRRSIGGTSEAIRRQYGDASKL